MSDAKVIPAQEKHRASYDKNLETATERIEFELCNSYLGTLYTTIIFEFRKIILKQLVNKG